ncbi:carbohydrate ABC transporter permease [Bosea eneae]|uniref:Carbohydrate ABC transporter permease n=1 Tax=Bosea eneae TaxID=151454 RepID=A0ABW0IZC9_9HYPH
MRIGDNWTAYVLAGPALALLLALYILPSLGVFVIAATDWQFGARSLYFVGAENFAALLEDTTFRQSFLNTLAFVSTTVPFTALLGLAIALLIESGRSLRAFYRAVHFLPFMATMVAMAMAWEALLHPTVGLVNQLMRLAGLPAINWLREESTALPVLGLIFVWQNLGYAMILFLAGLKAIPAELYDVT